MKFTWKIFAISLVLFGLTGLSIAGAAPAGTQSHKARALLEKAAANIGGARALRQLTGFTIAANGTRWVPDEGPTPGGTDPIGPFDVKITYDTAGKAVRLDYTAESPPWRPFEWLNSSARRCSEALVACYSSKF